MSGDDDDQICPLCCEELDISDQNFLPCKCGYQVCMWCWHHIKENLNNLCPACRTPYHDNPHAFSAVDKAEIIKNKKERKRKEKAEKESNQAKRERIRAATGVQHIPLPSEHPLNHRNRQRSGSDADGTQAPNRQQRRADAKARALLEQRQAAAAPLAVAGTTALGRPPRPPQPDDVAPPAPPGHGAAAPYGYGGSTENLQSLAAGDAYGFGRGGGGTGLDSLLGAARGGPAAYGGQAAAGYGNGRAAAYPPAPAPPPAPDLAGWAGGGGGAPAAGGRFDVGPRLDASPVAGAGFFDSGSIWSTSFAPAGDGWGAPAPERDANDGWRTAAPPRNDAYATDLAAAAATSVLGGGYGAGSSDGYAVDSLAADTAALNLLSGVDPARAYGGAGGAYERERRQAYGFPARGY